VDPHPASDCGQDILYLAHLSRRKGIFLVLEAFAAVLQQHPKARLTVAGQWQADDEKEEALNRIQQLGLGTHIRFLGEVTGRRKTEAFLQHQLFLFTPVAPEGLPWVILEAMSARLPVITTDQGAIREVVLDGITGRIVEPEAGAVAEAVRWMLEHPAGARNMGNAGFDRVSSQFSEKRYREKLIAVFKEVCAARGLPHGDDKAGSEQDIAIESHSAGDVGGKSQQGMIWS
jgi:glycosyltransferase involved in cell wall biosynthesis